METPLVRFTADWPIFLKSAVLNGNKKRASSLMPVASVADLRDSARPVYVLRQP